MKDSRSDANRGNMIGFALDAIEFAKSRTTSFTRFEMAEALETGDRTALRWLYALEARGLVEIVESKSGSYPDKWLRTQGPT